LNDNFEKRALKNKETGREKGEGEEKERERERDAADFTKLFLPIEN